MFYSKIINIILIKIMNINQSIILKKYICFSIMVLILKNLGGKFYGIKFKKRWACA